MAKKIKKVETPIDQRETFVSLQKNFADSDISVEEKLKTLYDLQQADNEIDKLVQLRGELPSEVEALEAEMQDYEEQIQTVTAVIAELTTTIASQKQNIIECEQAIANYHSQLDNISNSREFDSINKEIENQELERQIAEKRINDSRIAINEKKAELEDLKDRKSILDDDLKAKKEELASIVESTAAEEAKLQTKRDACASKIDARTMSAYSRIRQSEHNKLAVVTLYNGDSCGGCFNTITPQRIVEINSNKKLVICEHCGRIIVGQNIED